jgi:hypothetical protein
VLTEVETTPITIDPSGKTEPNSNLCRISVSYSEAARLTVEDIVEFIFEVALALSRNLTSTSPEHKMLLYAWVDEMAGQLRFSAVSKLPLPFACRLCTVDDPGVIAAQLLGCRYLDGIPLSDLENCRATNDKPEFFQLDVYVIQIPVDSL